MIDGAKMLSQKKSVVKAFLISSRKKDRKEDWIRKESRSIDGRKQRKNHSDR